MPPREEEQYFVEEEEEESQHQPRINLEGKAPAAMREKRRSKKE